METAPSEQDIQDLYLANVEDLSLFRWNAFLSGDSASLEAIRAEAEARASLFSDNQQFLGIAAGCSIDIARIEHYRGADNG